MGRINLRSGVPENGLRPFVSWLFRSESEVFLSGTREDGALELKRMKEKGVATIVQDGESSVVYGMPGEAVAINAAAYILSPAGIAEFFSGVTRAKTNRR